MRVKVVLDVHDLHAQSAFWCAAAGYEQLPQWSDRYLNLRPTGDAPDLLLQRVDDTKVAKNRLHLDLFPDDGPATIARLEALGACRIGEVVEEFLTEHGTRFQVMADPEDNEFCVVWRTAPSAWD